MPKEYFEPYCKHTVFDIQRSKDVMKNKLWFDEKCRYLYDKYKEKMYEYNKCRSDCKRHLLTECKTNYKSICMVSKVSLCDVKVMKWST